MTQVPRKTVFVERDSIFKSLLPGQFIDHREKDATQAEENDLAINAEMRWEATADEGYLTPNELFFVRSHASTPHIDVSSWILNVDGPGVERNLELTYDDFVRMPSISVVRAMECAGNGRIFFDEMQARETPGTQWRLGAIGVAEWTGVPLREILEWAGLKSTAREIMLESLDAIRMRRPLPVERPSRRTRSWPSA